MAKKILVLLGNPDSDSYCGHLADTYQTAAKEAGHEVKRTNIGDLHFDPILHRGYKVIQELEPDLAQLQEYWKWADHIVIVYPNWWNAMPALLKGMFDRMWLEGFAFAFDGESKTPVQRLAGKTARVVIVSGRHSPLKTWWKFGDYTNELQHGILEFAGIKTKVSALGPCDHVDGVCRNKWIEKIKKLGHEAC